MYLWVYLNCEFIHIERCSPAFSFISPIQLGKNNLQVYYMVDLENNGQLLNFSGCGNSWSILFAFELPWVSDKKILVSVES